MKKISNSLRAAWIGLLACALPCTSAATPIRVAVPPGPHAQVMNVVAEQARSQGLVIEVRIIADAESRNAALARGRVDAVSGQDLPTLDAAVRRHGYRFVSVASTLSLPMALYSNRLRRLDELREGDLVVIPRDRAQAGRALILLNNYGLLKLAEGTGLDATPRDVVWGRRTLRIEQADVSVLMAARRRAALVVAPAEVAVRAGLQPARDGLGLEDARSPYAHVLAVRRQDADAVWLRTLVAAYHSSAVKSYILARFNDSVRRPW
ncbi:MAG: MetQ/NlpA family ABC transporter substrate-binding protein [Rhodocyclaceae bacterium]